MRKKKPARTHAFFFLCVQVLLCTQHFLPLCRDEIRVSKKLTQTHALQLVNDPEDPGKFFIVNGHHRFEAFSRIRSEGWWGEVEGPHRLTPEELQVAEAAGLTYDDNVLVCDEVIIRPFVSSVSLGGFQLRLRRPIYIQ